MNRIHALAAIPMCVSLLCGLTSCGSGRPTSHDTAAAPAPAATPAPAPDPTAAVAVISPVAGFTGSGVIRFVEEPQGLHVTATISGLHPGQHGFHIHEYGDMSDSDLSGLGGHFNPTNQDHGGPTSEHHHAGDLGNLIVGDDGQGHVDEVVAGIALSGPTSIIGRSVVIHEGQDDLTSNPAGNSGKRIAAAVIGLAKP